MKKYQSLMLDALQIINDKEEHINEQRMRTIGLKGSVESFEMHDSLGNACAAALFKNSQTEFELYLWDFNSAIPRSVKGSLELCKASMNAFYYGKIKDGFEWPLADEMGKSLNS